MFGLLMHFMKTFEHNQGHIYLGKVPGENPGETLTTVTS
jgi:hypothetical protein